MNLRYSTNTIFFCMAISCLLAQNRSIDGTGNNISAPEMGVKGAPLSIITTLAFSDSISAPSGTDRPSPRIISNDLFAQESSIPDEVLSDYIWVFGQFIDHDLSLVHDSPFEPALISVPECDPFFDPNCTDRAVIPMMRSANIFGTGTDVNNPRMYANDVTSWLDGSMVYGSSTQRAEWLRSFEGGKLKTSKGGLLPFNTIDGELNSITDVSSPSMETGSIQNNRFYIAGDVRANENVLLLAMHALFVREHNRLAAEIQFENPTWEDEEIYQLARKINSGIIQEITFEEWLPSMGIDLATYRGYENDIDVAISNVFSAAAFRFGHTLVGSDILRLDASCNTILQGNMELEEAFFHPLAMLGTDLDPLFKGMTNHLQQNFDCKVVDDLRNFLFGQPGEGGLDLVSININRGRERGLPDYNSVRADIGLPRVNTFEEISAESGVPELLEQLYGSLDNIDPWVGMLAEDHEPGSMFGETIKKIVADQFLALRNGDRFYYQNDPGLPDRYFAYIQGTRLAEVIRRNTSIEQMSGNVFYMNPQCEEVELDAEQFNMLAYPNPFANNLSLALYSFAEEEIDLVIRDAFGKEILKQKLETEIGQNEWRLTMPESLVPGIYSVTVTNQTRSKSLLTIKN